MEQKEEKAIVLDFLPHGYPLEGRLIPIAQAIGANYFTLLQLVPRKGIKLQLKQEVYIGPQKRDEISYILGRLPKEKLTETAKIELQDFITKVVGEREAQFVEFFNKAEPINTRLHQLELLPGFGKKHMQAVLLEREKEPFKNFEDIKKRIKNIPDPKKTIEKRLIEELTGESKYRLFVS
jgi:putative nucleotide binding protein